MMLICIDFIVIEIYVFLGDRQLMQSLVFDARVTEWFSKNTSFNSKDDKG